MPRYHFHAENGRPIPDPEGLDLPDDRAAEVAAVRYLAELLDTYPDLLWDTRTLQVTVTSDRGLILFTLDVGAIISPAVSRPARCNEKSPGGEAGAP